MAKRLAPKKLISRLVKTDLTLNRAVLASLAAEQDFISKASLEEIALRVIKQYKSKFNDLTTAGVGVRTASVDARNKAALLIERVGGAIASEITESVQKAYRGEKYEWLPSDANEPDPLHQLKYGKIYKLGQGEMPGDRWGCRCGLRILVPETRFKL